MSWFMRLWREDATSGGREVVVDVRWGGRKVRSALEICEAAFMSRAAVCLEGLGVGGLLFGGAWDVRGCEGGCTRGSDMVDIELL